MAKSVIDELVISLETETKKMTGIDTAVASLNKLNTALNKISKSGAAKSLNKVSTATNKLSNNFSAAKTRTTNFGSSIKGLAVKLAAVLFVVRKVVQAISGWITESNKYIENLNLFRATMGEFADEALAYGEKVGALMGIDPSDWIRNQGVFATLIKGFGLAGEQAAFMSKNLTQLGYDLSSFFNIPVETAMSRIQSGLASNIRPMRQFGYDLSVASLEAIALSHGIDKAFTSMTQGEKTILRYTAMMEQLPQYRAIWLVHWLLPPTS